MPSINKEARDDEYPAATFIVFVFNQASFVEQAIDSAFAQDYPNLQIVLSDDGSSDGSFEIMQRRADAYRGPHRVCAIRTPRNFGLVNHVFCAFAVADGELIIAAAGDDISLPHRVRALAEHWKINRPAIIYSAWNLVDIEGRFLRYDHSANTRKFDCADYFPDREVTIAFGCTAAYARDFLKGVTLPNYPIWAEDYFLSLVALMNGDTIEYINEPLVSYRQNTQALRNFTAVDVDFLAYERREMKFFDGLVVLTRAFEEIVEAGHPAAGTRIRRDMIARDIAWYSYRAEWAGRSIFNRLGYTATLRDERRLRWALPRVLGLQYFIMVKAFVAKIARRDAGASG